MVSPDHPRYNSLLLREKIINGYQSGILAEAGMIAHGRGEAFDYLIGEITTKVADESIETAVAALLLAKNPVLSVNGNTAALVSDEIIELANVLNAKIEINLFYRTPERINAILKLLNEKGAREVLGTDDLVHIKGINHPRGDVSSEGIYNSDVVLVPLEDGDRTEKLVESGKFVIAIDLNPLSRTSKKASITIVDNITRAMPLLIKKTLEFKDMNENELQNKLNNFNNDINLKESLKVMLNSINSL